MSEQLNMFAPSCKEYRQQSVQLTSKAEIDQAIRFNSNSLKIIPKGVGKKETKSPKLKQKQKPNELIDVDNSCFYSPKTRFRDGGQEDLSVSMMKSERIADENCQIIKQFFSNEPMINKRTIAVHGSADSRREMINANDPDLEDRLEEEKHQRE